MFFGISSGVFAAIFQDAGYVCSRLYVRKTNRPTALLVDSMIILGAFCALLLPFLFIFGVPESTAFILPLLGVMAGSMGGQFFLFRSERIVEPSRISSLMGLRIVNVAVASIIFFGESYHWLQWSGIILATLSAFMLNWVGGRIKFGGMGSFGLSLLFYCLSDLSVKHMVHGFGLKSLILSSFFAMCIVNITGALLLLPLLKREREGFWGASPFAVTWFLKQFFLYCCYASVGPVLANVILSIRGPFSIVIAFILKGFGLKAGEGKVDLATWIRRGIATIMMTCAIIFYTLGS